MGYSQAVTVPDTEISVTREKTPDIERDSEKLSEEQIPTETRDDSATREPEEVVGSKPAQKKSLSFKLALIGLAASLFVYQIDATCLGIALPVSEIPA